MIPSISNDERVSTIITSNRSLEASKKVTITFPEEQALAIRSLVRSGGSKTVSSFVQGAVARALDDLAGWETSDESTKPGRRGARGSVAEALDAPI